MANKDTKGLSKELLDELLAGPNPKSVFDSGGLPGDLKRALAERMLNAELHVHLAGEPEAGCKSAAGRSNRVITVFECCLSRLGIVITTARVTRL